MLEGLKQRWREFKRGRPGNRFQERFERNQQARSERSWLTRYLKPLAGIVLLVTGLVFCVIPGPGLPLLLVGLGLLATVSRRVAVTMDWLEVRIRDVISRFRRWWARASKLVRYAVIVLTVALAGGAGYGGLRIVMERLD